ncbi:MAG TPA: type II secretion system protein [Propionicimonas sp.]|uniref:PilW family protein n=1 Tax=Propionicimonas sp. TaxID=1955623 RepID=UPI002F42E161
MRARLLRMRGEGSDRGVTLIELLVTMILMGIVSSLVVGAVAQASRILTHADDEEKGLQDAKVILDRLGRDIRESREVVCDGGLADPTDATSGDPSCNAHLQLWVDANSDYMKQPTEIITWRLEQNPDGIHFDVWRITGTGAGGSAVKSARQATSLIVRMAFTYDAGGVFANVNEVRLGMRYDSIVGRGTSEREVAFSARLRNKG